MIPYSKPSSPSLTLTTFDREGRVLVQAGTFQRLGQGRPAEWQAQRGDQPSQRGDSRPPHACASLPQDGAAGARRLSVTPRFAGSG